MKESSTKEKDYKGVTYDLFGMTVLCMVFNILLVQGVVKLYLMTGRNDFQGDINYIVSLLYLFTFALTYIMTYRPFQKYDNEQGEDRGVIGGLLNVLGKSLLGKIGRVVIADSVIKVILIAILQVVLVPL